MDSNHAVSVRQQLTSWYQFAFDTFMLAIIPLLASLILLYLCLQSWSDSSLLHQWGIGELSYGQINTALYLQVSISSLLTYVSADVAIKGLSTYTMSATCLVGMVATAGIFILLACVLPDMTLDEQAIYGLCSREPKTIILFVLLYCIVWWFIQVATKYLLEFGLRTLIQVDKNYCDGHDGATAETQVTTSLLHA
ncbi:hypothetical protein EON65_45180 [archaeon]|nr:MAG: hypothetical protein EON65_45180 [archaeon]